MSTQPTMEDSELHCDKCLFLPFLGIKPIKGLCIPKSLYFLFLDELSLRHQVAQLGMELGILLSQPPKNAGVKVMYYHSQHGKLSFQGSFFKALDSPGHPAKSLWAGVTTVAGKRLRITLCNPRIYPVPIKISIGHLRIVISFMGSVKIT